MTVFRAAALVAALITVALNASYGFKTSTVFEYAVLFATLNAALDIAKCSCLVGAARAWDSGRHLAAVLLFLLFWPLLANSLWCAFSEVTFNRAAESTRHEGDTQARKNAKADHARATAELSDLEASPLYKASTACALPQSNKQRTLCARHAAATTRLNRAADALAQQQTPDPTPQLTLLSTLTGIDMPLLLLLAAFCPIALAELCGSVGFYLTSQQTRKFDEWKRLIQPAPDVPATSQTKPQSPPVQHTPAAIKWTAINP